ncbi:MAG: DUF2804 domain-containing protein [Oscillospiraceae bacterium]
MENRITEPGAVLNKQGEILPGYSTGSILAYHRKDIKAPFYRIKEWDFYQVSDGEKCLQFTYGHASYAGQVCVMLFNFKTGEKIVEISRLLALPFGRLHLPENAEENSDIVYEKGGINMRFKVVGDVRYLSFSYKDFEAQITLERKNPESIVINIPFDEYKTAFYYNHKINCMTARGRAVYKGEQYTFGEGSFGLLDWGRGVWPFHNEWYWSNGTGLVDGQIFGFNLGKGFGNTENATENTLFYGGHAHKLGKVHIDLGTEYMKPWHLYDDEGRLDLTLVPCYDRTTKMKVLFVDNCCHQMFGEFSGKAVLDDGTVLDVKALPAFAEHAVNNW